MSISLSCRLAWRYVTHRTSSTITTMMAICFTSIFIGTFSLALTTAIMRGFEYETHKKLQSIYPSLFIKAPDGTTLQHEKLIPFLKKNLQEKVTEIAPYLLKQALIHRASSEEPTCLITLKGIDPQKEPLVTALKNMIQPTTALTALLQQDIIIGKELAERLEVSVGDQLILLCNENDEESFKEAQLRSIPVTVTGIVSTGISDYDERLALVTLGLCEKIWSSDCITYLGLQLQSPRSEKEVLTFLKSIDGVESYSWKDLYPSLVSALKLEKHVMFILLLLITLVASMNIVSLLFMYITHKKTDIALLALLGMSWQSIVAIFMLVSLFLTVVAATVGLLAAYAVGRFLQTYPLITLPDSYYVTHLPVTLELSLFVLVFALALVLSIGASCIPLRSIQNLNITNILRTE